MYWVIGLSIIAIIIRAFLDKRNFGELQDVVDAVEDSRVDYNYNRILPHDVSEVEVVRNSFDNIEITFTPISVEQINETLFIVGVKSKSQWGDIAFDFHIDTTVQKSVTEGTFKAMEFSLIALDLNSKEADRLLILLASIFAIEISDKSQIVKELILLTRPLGLNLENVLNDKIEFLTDFLLAENQNIPTRLKFEMNLAEGYFKIIEFDKLYRPILIDRLTFKPNIKNER